MTPTSETAGPVGLLGGTFDPIHLGHVEVARQAAARLGLPTVLLVPSAVPPHRPPPLASAADRLAMARIAAAGDARLEVSDVEVARGGLSYTVDTIRELRGRMPGVELVLLLGVDAALDFGAWHDAGGVVEGARIAVFNRAGRVPPDREALAAAGLPGWAEVISVDSPEISASRLRSRLAAGEECDDQLPAGVADYIREHGLYRDADA